jgi:biopolymer transport protein ExbD
VLWNGTEVATRGDLKSYIADAAAKDPQPEVHLSVEKRAYYEKMTQVLFALERGNLKKIGFVTEAHAAP